MHSRDAASSPFFFFPFPFPFSFFIFRIIVPLLLARSNARLPLVKDAPRVNPERGGRERRRDRETRSKVIAGSFQLDERSKAGGIARKTCVISPNERFLKSQAPITRNKFLAARYSRRRRIAAAPPRNERFEPAKITRGWPKTTGV